ncbi:Uncharacterised protein [BD1-7 clade bacterium]|uniref:Fatty acid hydroxylase domain-containing protein n=1 Tax=BD1-7 clade bacterium TaxID=2029982 RepID=A0A5S9NW36_9GAMM|nr:Uncharacterised protein [BD1-7 clade bacterium]CAA0095564.1 Uncharacterised protein [BD1-7 clade bacterium]
MEWLADLPVWAQIQQALVAPVAAIQQPEKRLFSGFLFSSLVMIVIWLAVQGRLNRHELRRLLLNKRYWFHPSSWRDIWCVFINAVIRVVFIAPILASHLAGIIFVSRTLQHFFSDSPDFDVSPALVIAGFSIVFFIIEDASRFCLHFCMHKVPWLWQIHKTHHSAEVLTPLTLYRSHPLEMMLYQVRQLLVFSLVGGCFLWLFGRGISTWSILGVDALGFAFNLLGANLRHSHIWIGFGKLERLFISPAQHQIHHSADVQHFDSNFGTCLAFWDRLAGSWIASGSTEVSRFGLAGEQQRSLMSLFLFKRESVLKD